MSRIPAFDQGERPESMSEAMAEAGALVIQGVTSAGQRERLTTELAEHLERAPVESEVDPDAFYPGHTRRVIGLISRSETSRELAMHPSLQPILDATLLPNCERYQLHVASALVVGPGARPQVLHREDDVYPFFEVPRPNTIVASMWAMSDFTAENGATQIVPGSHRWPADRSAEQDEIVQAEMSAGDVLLWHGGTLHGAGGNTSTEWRFGVFLSYSLGWLRQEENQYLDVPPAVAATLPKPLRDLVGYKMHGESLGFFDPSLQE